MVHDSKPAGQPGNECIPSISSSVAGPQCFEDSIHVHLNIDLQTAQTAHSAGHFSPPCVIDKGEALASVIRTTSDCARLLRTVCPSAPRLVQLPSRMPQGEAGEHVEMCSQDARGRCCGRGGPTQWGAVFPLSAHAQDCPGSEQAAVLRRMRQAARAAEHADAAALADSSSPRPSVHVLEHLEAGMPQLGAGCRAEIPGRGRALRKKDERCRAERCRLQVRMPGPGNACAQVARHIRQLVR